VKDSFSIELPEATSFAEWEDRLRGAGITLSIRSRETKEYPNGDFPTSLEITGEMIFREEKLAFEWFGEDSKGCIFWLNFGSYTHGRQNVLIEELDRIFPDPRKNRPTLVLHPTPRERARNIRNILGCLLPLLFVLGVIGFAIYGFLTWLDRLL
jgi:hypothetical protein